MKLLLILSLSFFINSDEFEKVFAEDYKNAEQFISEQWPVFEMFASNMQTDGKLIAAISFPEAIRYSMIQDFLEIGAMELIYVNTGKVDFSIGNFQMKPSFIKKLEYLTDSMNLSHFVPDRLNAGYRDLTPVQIRQERLNRLTNSENQIFYLNLFYKIMEERFPDSSHWDTEYKIRFFSTAYNYDCCASQEMIEVYMKKKYFPWGAYNDKMKYNYADIAWYYFQNLN